MEKKLKYFHITTVLLALLLPILPSLIHLNDGYIKANMRTTLCFGRSPAVTFFALILPLSGLMAVATSALVTVFWKILKVSYKPYMHVYNVFIVPDMDSINLGICSKVVLCQETAAVLCEQKEAD